MSGHYGYIGPQVMPGPGQMPPPPPPPSGMMAMGMDPACNNAPLQFNMNKGKPPMAIPGEGAQNGGDGGNKGKDRPGMVSSPPSGPNGPPGSMMNQANMMNAGMMGGPMGFGPMMGDPSMMMAMGPMGFNQFGYMGPMAGMQQMGQESPSQKEILTFKTCVLYPPPPTTVHMANTDEFIYALPPSTRDRPPGCRTIFVGGLPENITEEILREIFESCGNICSIRVSKKNFAHIRFDFEDSVDKALYISGYRIKIEDKDDKEDTGRLHVDYAQARDDQYEWECQQRALDREMRHRARLEEETRNPPSPPPVCHFSTHEASTLLESLKGDQEFMNSSHVLVTWLERGDCNRRTANTFYSIIQSVHAHQRRLLTEKMQHDMEYEQMKAAFRQKLEAIVKQFEQITSVMMAATKQKAWDHFTKAQRKNIDTWKKQAEEMSKYQQDEYLRNREEAEMEMSDNEDAPEGPPKKKLAKTEEETMEDFQKWHYPKLKEENESLRFQLEAYKNEVDLLKTETSSSGEEKDKQLKLLQQTLQGMQQQLMEAKRQIRTTDDELSMTKRQLTQAEAAKKASARSDDKKDDDMDETKDGDVSGASDPGLSSKSAAAASADIENREINEREAKLIGLIATFLHVHPFGASVDYICSYLQRLEFIIRSSEVETLLERLPTVFRQELKGVGAMLERRWKFLGFDNVM